MVSTECWRGGTTSDADVGVGEDGADVMFGELKNVCHAVPGIACCNPLLNIARADEGVELVLRELAYGPEGVYVTSSLTALADKGPSPIA